MSKNTGAVILAAGSSSRLGQPKQLLKFQNETLLQRTIDLVIPFNFNPALVVLGAHSDQIKESTNLENVKVALNENWPEGIASSIRLGVEKSIKLNESLDSILFLLSDQPCVSTHLIDELLVNHKNGKKPITASSYKESIGVPVIFDKIYFPRLMELTGDVGAKKIILQNSEDVDEVVFEEGYFDIDTAEDYEQLQDMAK